MGRPPRPPAVHVVDFETEGIQDRPHYPPKPVGVSVQPAGARVPRYYAWGHPYENNCTVDQARDVLIDLWRSDTPLLFHNAKFDVDVGQVHLDLPLPDWRRIHDTMYLLFLQDPHARSLSLKPSAARLLGMPPEEQDAVKDWILAHKKELEARYGKFKPSEWGAHIAHAPGALVGRYAKGDVERTLKLFRKLYAEVGERGMLPAYDRERALMPILLENERTGMRVDLPALERDLEVYGRALTTADTWLARRLGAPGLNVDNDRDMAAALKASGVVTSFVPTATGRDSVSKKNLTPDRFQDPRVARVFGYRNRLATCLRMFMGPWYELGSANDGYISTNWNQVRQPHGAGAAGTRTGRPSTHRPNFLNLSKNFYDKGDGYEHPKHLRSLPELPLVRRYILPDPGGVFCHRDYNQQELRILAHFEDGALMAAYNENPLLDVHTFVQQLIRDIAGLVLERRYTKTLNFGKIYGMGAGAMAESLGVSVEVVRRIRAAHDRALPGLAALEAGIKDLVRAGKPIVTWGGREYYVEPPMMIGGRMVDFTYKLLNYLIQGSAADCTKQALLNYHAIRREGRFLVTVYDEINLSAPHKAAKAEMRLLKDAMSDVHFDVPMLTDGKMGPNWADLTKVED